MCTGSSASTIVPCHEGPIAIPNCVINFLFKLNGNFLSQTTFEAFHP